MKMEPKTNKFRLGQVVGCYLNSYSGYQGVEPFYGVVVELPKEHYDFYRVRVSTYSFGDYVECGVREADMEGQL